MNAILYEQYLTLYGALCEESAKGVIMNNGLYINETYNDPAHPKWFSTREQAIIDGVKTILKTREQGE